MSKQSIWARLKAKGFSDTACAAIMGNMDQESKFRPNNVEDRSGIPDEQYTAQVDNGSYSRHRFLSDSYGYGLCQWTYYTRKAALFDFAKQRGVSIADEQMQIDWMWEEMHQAEFRGVFDTLMSDADLYDMTAKYMCVFENPADQSDAAINYRASLALGVYREFAGTDPAVPSETPQKEQEPDAPTTPFWPPRMLCEGMVGADVYVLQSHLLAHGYNVPLSGTFDNKTKAMVLAFQGENGLDTDGVAGPLTFRVLGVNV